MQELQRHSLMLSQISGEVSEWCNDPQCTTLLAVRLMKAELYKLRSDRLYEQVDDEIQNRYVP